MCQTLKKPGAFRYTISIGQSSELDFNYNLRNIPSKHMKKHLAEIHSTDSLVESIFTQIYLLTKLKFEPLHIITVLTTEKEEPQKLRLYS